MNRSRTRMSIRRRIAIALLSVATSLVALFGIVAPASAAPTDYCSLGTACVWDDPDYNTNGSYAGLLWFESFVTPMSNYNYAGTSVNAGDTADSWYNNGRYATACFYNVAGYSTASGYACLNPGNGDGNIANTSGIIQNVTWDPNSAKFV